MVHSDWHDVTIGILIESVVLVLISTIFTGLRFWSAAVVPPQDIRKRYHVDDWLCLASLISTFVTLSISAAWLDPNLDKTTGLKLFQASFCTWKVAITLPKLSALCLYLRLFGGAKDGKFRIAIFFTMLLSLLLLLVILIAEILICLPIAKLWEPNIEGVCLDLKTAWLYMSSAELILDLLVLWMPVIPLWQLKLRCSQKLLLVAVFLFGYSAVAVTIGQTVAIKRLGDDFIEGFPYNSAELFRWVFAWPPVAIISICLPASFSLARRAYCHGTQALFTTQDFNRCSSLSQAPSRVSSTRTVSTRTVTSSYVPEKFCSGSINHSWYVGGADVEMPTLSSSSTYTQAISGNYLP